MGFSDLDTLLLPTNTHCPCFILSDLYYTVYISKINYVLLEGSSVASFEENHSLRLLETPGPRLHPAWCGHLEPQFTHFLW